MGQRGGGEGVAELGHVAQLEGLDGGIAESTFVEVAQSDAAAFIGVPQLVHAPGQRPLLDHGQGLAFALLHLLLRCALLLGQIDVVALGQPADGFHVAEVLVLLQEGDAVPALATSEALEDPQVGTDVEAGCLLVVEGAQTQVARSLALERHELAHHLLHAGGVLHLLDGVRLDHGGVLLRRYPAQRLPSVAVDSAWERQASMA